MKMILRSWQSVTGGTLGIKNIPKPQDFRNGTDSTELWIILSCLFSSFSSVYSASSSSFQDRQSTKRIKGDELASAMMGVNVNFYKILAMVISAMICAGRFPVFPLNRLRGSEYLQL